MADPLHQTTPPTDAELNELLGKPGPPIEVDPDQLAAAVALQRAEAKSETTTRDQRRSRYHEVQRLWLVVSADVAKHRAAMEEAAERYRALGVELLPLEDEFRSEDEADG